MGVIGNGRVKSESTPLPHSLSEILTRASQIPDGPQRLRELVADITAGRGPQSTRLSARSAGCGTYLPGASRRLWKRLISTRTSATRRFTEWVWFKRPWRRFEMHSMEECVQPQMLDHETERRHPRSDEDETRWMLSRRLRRPCCT